MSVVQGPGNAAFASDPHGGREYTLLESGSGHSPGSAWRAAWGGGVPVRTQAQASRQLWVLRTQPVWPWRA